MVSSSRFPNFNIKDDHIRLWARLKGLQYLLLVSLLIDDILIRKEADIPIRPHQRSISAQANATLRHMKNPNIPAFMFKCLHTVMATLVYNDRIRLNMHIFRQLMGILLHHRG